MVEIVNERVLCCTVILSISVATADSISAVTAFSAATSAPLELERVVGVAAGVGVRQAGTGEVVVGGWQQQRQPRCGGSMMVHIHVTRTLRCRRR
jgi:hypothetical protein